MLLGGNTDAALRQAAASALAEHGTVSYKPIVHTDPRETHMAKFATAFCTTVQHMHTWHRR